MTIGKNIKRIRLQKGLTQAELGSLIGISDTMVRKYDKRWMLYQAELADAERILEEKDKKYAIQIAEEKFRYWMDTYS